MEEGSRTTPRLGYPDPLLGLVFTLLQNSVAVKELS